MTTLRSQRPRATPEGGQEGETTELVALSFRQGGELVRRLFDAWDKGLAVLPLDPSLPRPALEKVLRSVRPGRLLTDSGEAALEGTPVARGTALVMATSGSSGEPKGVELSHGALNWSSHALTRKLGAAADGPWLCCLPLHHIAGLMVVLRARLRGALPVIHDRFDEYAIDAERRAATLSLVPAMLRRLLESGADLSRFSAILLGGGPVPEDLLERAGSKGARIITTYGMTETCGGCVLDGFPLEGAAIEIADEQILLNGPMLFSRYRLQPGLTKEALQAGWFHTSDYGSLLPDGRLSVLGRRDDVIITGGEKASASHVEHILAEHPSIREAAVVGLASRAWGQEIAAALVVEPGQRLELDEVRHFVASRAPRWMAPKRIATIPSIPKSGTGKTLRAEIARLFEVHGRPE